MSYSQIFPFFLIDLNHSLIQYLIKISVYATLVILILFGLNYLIKCCQIQKKMKIKLLFKNEVVGLPKISEVSRVSSLKTDNKSTKYHISEKRGTVLNSKNEYSTRCPKCSKIFSSELMLKVHLNSCEIISHTSEVRIESYACVCGANFKNEFSLNNHKNNCHFKCPKCSKIFSSQLMLKVHLNSCNIISNGVEVLANGHICACGKGFQSKQGLLMHQKYCYSACVCGKLFETQIKLKTHQRFCDKFKTENYSKSIGKNMLIDDGQKASVIEKNKGLESNKKEKAYLNSKSDNLKEQNLNKSKLPTKKGNDVRDINISYQANKSVKELKHVNFSTSKVNQSSNLYPIVKVPRFQTVIRSFRNGANSRKGYTEKNFYSKVEETFKDYFDIYNDVRIAIGKDIRPYEPDIVMISAILESNIHIDIEIDEPYTGYQRLPIHCYPDDIDRDNYFISRGWIVLRFSEKQIHEQPKECLYEIAKIISLIDSKFEIPKFLIRNNTIIKEKCWNTHQAIKWEQEKYRESYLNHLFSRLDESTDSLPLMLNSQELAEEKSVIHIDSKIKKSEAIIRANIENQLSVKNHQVFKGNLKQEKELKPKIKHVQKITVTEKSKIKEIIKSADGRIGSFEIVYRNRNYETSVRTISNIHLTDDYMDYGYLKGEHFIATCSERGEDTPFKVERIISITSL